MKQLLLIILFSTAIFGQTGKSVLTQAQKDSIGAMIRDSSLVLNVKSYGVIGNGVTDDSNALETIINTYSSSKVIYLPKGTYNLETFIDTIDTELVLMGDGAETILRGDTSSSTNYFNIKSNVTFQNLCLDQWRKPFRVSTSVDTIESIAFDNVIFTNMRERTIHLRDLTAPYVIINEFKFQNCTIKDSESGIKVITVINNALVTNNIFRDLTDSIDDYDPDDGAQAVMLGNEVNYSYDDSTNYLVSNNIFSNISTALDTPIVTSTRAILVYGSNIEIGGNVIERVNGMYALGNNETIYTKGINVNIHNNTIKNSGKNGQAMITLKGGVHNNQTSKVVDNIILLDSFYTSTHLTNAMYIDQPVTIEGNLIQFDCPTTINYALRLDYEDLDGDLIVRNNDIKIREGRGLFITPSDSSNVTIENNIIECKLYPIKFNDQFGGGISNSINIIGNTFHLDSSYACDIKGVRDLAIENNKFYINSSLGEYLWAVNSGTEDVKISGNEYYNNNYVGGLIYSNSIQGNIVLTNETIFNKGNLGTYYRGNNFSMRNLNISNLNVYYTNSTDTTTTLIQVRDGIVTGDIIIKDCAVSVEDTNNVEYFAQVRMDTLAGNFIAKDNYLKNVDNGFHFIETGSLVQGTIYLKNNIINSNEFFSTSGATIGRLVVDGNDGYTKGSTCFDVYESDFGTADGFTASGGSILVYTDTTAFLDTLTFVSDANNSTHYIYKDFSQSVGAYYSTEIQVYLPSTNVSLNRLILWGNANWGYSIVSVTETDKWVTVQRFGYAEDTNLTRFWGYNNAASSYLGTATDKFYVRSIKVKQCETF